MLLAIPVGQFYGSLIEDVVWLLVGVWLAYVRPHRIRRKVASAELSEDDARARLRKLPPTLGYAALFFGITQTYISFDKIGLFGRFETLASFIMLGIVVALIAVWLLRRRRAK